MPSKHRSISKKRIPRRRKISRFLPVLAVIAAIGLVLAGSGFAFAASQETHDSFCASCHTQPESTFYSRSTAVPAVDLASFHTGKEVRCIDCHSGEGLFGRMQAELLGARNALAWYTHTAIQPATMTYPIQDVNCLKCHDQVAVARTQNNHFHYFLAQWQSSDPSNAGRCTSCHEGHDTAVVVQEAYLNESKTGQVCDACHAVLGGGG